VDDVNRQLGAAGSGPADSVFPMILRALDPKMTAAEILAALEVAGVRLPVLDHVLQAGTAFPDPAAVSCLTSGRRLAITGAGGSIGDALCQLLTEADPTTHLQLVDHDENALSRLYELMAGRGPIDVDSLSVADVRDRDQMIELFGQFKPDVVFHAAGLRQIPLLERQPSEAIKTNVIGTENVLAAAIAAGVDCLVNLSSFEAAEATSVLGATERAAEQLTTRTAIDANRRFLSVRLANVIGSRGSMLSTFLHQLGAGRPLTVTNPDATRYFIGPADAAGQLAVAAAIGGRGEVLVVEAGAAVRILQLAIELLAALAPDGSIQLSELRPGERLHSVLVGGDEIGLRATARILRLPGNMADPWPQLTPITGQSHNELNS
jgi:FlaA1/EpsC-like NDP-sugar epimerase